MDFVLETAPVYAEVERKLRHFAYGYTVYPHRCLMDWLQAIQLFRLMQKLCLENRKEVATLCLADERFAQSAVTLILDGLPSSDNFDLEEPYLYPMGLGLNNFNYDEAEEIVQGEWDLDSLRTFLVWLKSDQIGGFSTDVPEYFSGHVEHFDWPFEYPLRMPEKTVTRSQARNYLARHGYEELMPALDLAFWPPNNLFFDCQQEDEPYDFNLRNLRMLQREYAKVKGFMEKFFAAKEIVECDPHTLRYLAAAMHVSEENINSDGLVRVRVKA